MRAAPIPSSCVGLAALAAAFAFTGFGYATGACAVAAGAVFAGIAASWPVRTGRNGRCADWAAGGVIYAGVAFLGPALLRRDTEFGFPAFLFLAVTVWTTDICRLCGGPRCWRSVAVAASEPEQDLVGRLRWLGRGGCRWHSGRLCERGEAGWRRSESSRWGFRPCRKREISSNPRSSGVLAPRIQAGSFPDMAD